MRPEDLLARLEAGYAYDPMYGQLCNERDQLKAENAKLRELCEDMMRFFEDGSYCTTCEKVAECDASEIYECDCLMRSVFKGRMRELGVEVD